MNNLKKYTKVENFITILESNGVLDAIEALQAHPNKTLVRVFAGRCAEYVLPIFEFLHPEDNRARKAVETALKGRRNTATAYAAWDAASTACNNYSSIDDVHIAAYSACASAAYAIDIEEDVDCVDTYAAYSAAHAAINAIAKSNGTSIEDVDLQWLTKLFRELFDN